MAKRQLPSPEVLRQLLRYEPDTGKLFWKERPESMFASKGIARAWNDRHAEREAGSDNGAGYLCISLGRLSVRVHRVAWAMTYNEWPSNHIDHVNHNRRDNRIANLRDVTQSENNKNRPPQKNNKTGFVGVGLHRKSGKWIGRINTAHGKLHLGLFDCLGAAIKARREAEKQHGYSAGHGGVRLTDPEELKFGRRA